MKLSLPKHLLLKYVPKTPNYFCYGRSVVPSINKNRHIIKVLGNHLSKEQQIQALKQSSFDRLDYGYQRGDALCDAWIAYAIEHNLPAYGMPLFNQVLTSPECSFDNGIATFAASQQQIPQPLQDLFIQAASKPSWYDAAQIPIACRALTRYPFQQGLILQSVSLMGGYCVPALAEPLLATGQLTDNVVGRIARTLCFLGAVMIPQGLEYNAATRQWGMGFRQTLKTRVIHGLVRHKLITNSYSQPWNTKKFGIPINQSDMIATNMSFSLIVIHGLLALGCELCEAERIAILHLWRYVGHIIGIDDELIPKTEVDYNKWAYAYFSTQHYEPKPAQGLAQSLHKLPLLIEDSNFKGMAKLEQNLRAGITRSYWGDDICDELGLPKPKFVDAGVFGVAKMQLLMEQLQKSSSIAEQLMQKSAENYRNVIKQKYLAVCPEVEPLFDELQELAMRSDWE